MPGKAELVKKLRDMRPVGSLILLPDNPRHGDIGAISQSLERFGQQKPIVVNRDGVILAGNHTFQAAKALGWEEIWVAESELEGADQPGFALADNRLSDLATYDHDILIKQLKAQPDLLGTGYDGDDLDLLIAEFEQGGDLDQPEPSFVVEDHSVALGDIWHLGRHKMMIGDARLADTYQALIRNELVNVAFTSPPYAEQRTYDKDSGFKPIPPGEYVDWWEPVQAAVAKYLTPDGSFFVNIKPPGSDLDTDLYVFDLVIAHVRRWGWHWATEFCWERNGVPKAPVLRFKNQFEPVYQFTRARWKFRPDNVRHYSDSIPIPGGEGIGDTNWAGEQGQPNAVMFGNQKRRTDVQGQYHPDAEATAGLAYPGNRLPGFMGSHEAVGHPAAFPIGLPKFFIEAFTDPDDNVLDQFLGSGSTILAAEETGRVGYGIELSPEYANMTISRWNAHYPDQPAHK